MAINPQIPINLSVVNLFNEVFGINLNNRGADIEPLPAKQTANFAGTQYYEIDDLGREVFLPITFKYTDNEGILQTLKLYHAVISAVLPVSYVRTKLTQRAGVVKELISPDDVTMNIFGFLISDKLNHFPENKVRELVKLKSFGRASISNVISDIYLLDSGFDTWVAIDELEFPEVYAKKDVKPFRMRVTSDNTFNLLEV